MKKILFFLFWACFLTANAAPAPNFTVTTSDNQVKKLYEDYINQGKTVVIEAFFTTCPPCASHAPYWQALYQSMLAQYPNQVEFILLSTLSSDNNVKVAQYKTNKSLTMPGVGNDGGSIAALQPYISGQFGDFLGTPTFILIEPNTGEVHFDIRGTSAQNTMSLIEQTITAVVPKTCFIKSYSGALVSSAEVTVDAPGFDTAFITNGAYSLSYIPQLEGQTYTLSVSKTDEVVNWVSTADLVAVSKHILAVEAFTQPWQPVAADVNCSGSVTTTDIVLMRKVVLGLTLELPCGSWRFIPSPPDSMLTSGECQEYKGVQLGNVNTQLLTSEEADDRQPEVWSARDAVLWPGQSYRIALLSPTDHTAMEGLQAAFRYDPAMLNIESIVAPQLTGFGAGNYAVLTDGQVRISWENPEGEDLTAGAPVWEIAVTCLKSCKLSEALQLNAGAIPNELYENNGKTRLSWAWAPAINGTSIAPNPAHGGFRVALTVENAQTVPCTLTDSQGRVVRRYNLTLQDGFNQPYIDCTGLPPGLYYWRSAHGESEKIMLR